MRSPTQSKIMQVSVDNLQNVAPLRDLCIERARTRISTESLLSLPKEVLRDLFGTSSTKRGCIIIINDFPLQSDGNMVTGAICGYHVLRKEFLVGDYETSVFQEPLENTTWRNSVHVNEIVMFIQKCFAEQAIDIWKETSSFSKLNESALENGNWIEAALYQHVARWVLKNNCHFGCSITDEFIKLAQKETIKLRMIVL